MIETLASLASMDTVCFLSTHSQMTVGKDEELERTREKMKLKHDEEIANQREELRRHAEEVAAHKAELARHQSVRFLTLVRRRIANASGFTITGDHTR